jgi:redox-sensitive bicupin YhaK (pirin superfamily)
MSERSIRQVVHSIPQPGTGILHPFPTADLGHLDPFVFLDTGAPRQMNGGEIYVGPHPHRGVQPVSLLFRGRIEHRDSLGTHKTVDSGGMQWLVAGAGALHEEVLQGDGEGIFHMAQLWINVPADLKMAPAEHHAKPADSVPELTTLGAGSTVRLYAGDLNGSAGPAPLPTPVLVAHVLVEADGDVSIPVPVGWTASVCVVAGSIDSHGSPYNEGDTLVFADDGATLSLSSTHGGEVLLMCGEPIGEPVAMGGGFVMTTREEIEQAFDDYQHGRMGYLEASR